MTVREVIYRYVYNNYTGFTTLSNGLKNFYYEFSNSDPAYVMKIVTPGERKGFLCEADNGGGEYLLQFDFSASQASGYNNQFSVDNKLELLKNWIVTNLAGQITISGNTYRLYNVRVEGVRRLADPDGLYYGSFFEVTLNWSSI